MNKIRNIFEILKTIQKRPGMFLIRKKSIYSLLEFNYGYQLGVGDSGFEDKLLYEEFNKFQDYITENTIGIKNRTNECWLYWDCLLKVSDDDEEKALDLFFKLLDEFIEKEGIKLDMN